MRSQRRPKATDRETPVGTAAVNPAAPPGTTGNAITGTAAPAVAAPGQLNKLSGSSTSVRSKTENIGPEGAIDEEGADWLPPKVLLKPPGQLGLSEKEMNEEFTRLLKAENPHAPQNISRYNYKEQVYKTSPNVDQFAMHFEIDGHLVYKGLDEGGRSGGDARKLAEIAMGNVEKAVELTGTGSRLNLAAIPPPSGEEDEAVALASASGKTKAPTKNQFNCSDRASQTLNNPQRERNTNTDPPPHKDFQDTVNQWAIYDAYVEDIVNKEKLAKEKAKGGAATGKPAKVAPPGAAAGGGAAGGGQSAGAGEDSPTTTTSTVGGTTTLTLPPVEQQEDIMQTTAYGRIAKLMERMLNQNSFDDVAEDYKYWEDPADEFRGGKGILMPLWKFSYDKNKRKQVTSVCWSPCYKDLFFAGYGSYDFMRQGPGLIVGYTFKNPTFPEFVFRTDSGVLSVHVHPQRAYLLAVGTYDGSVLVYDLMKKTNPIFQSSVKGGKHSDPVWQVYWQRDDLDENPNFISISSDGRVTLWTLMHNELLHTDVIELKLEDDDITEDEKAAAAAALQITEDRSAAIINPELKQGGLVGTTAQNLDKSSLMFDAPAASNEILAYDQKLFGLAGGICFDFHKNNDYVFIVGTEEGHIHSCSKAYSSKYLRSFEGHRMPVYAVKFNPFSSNIFLSASADWTVKLWDMDEPKSILTFDLNNSVNDVAWSPYSDTVFAAVTADGKLYIFDLSEDKHGPVCEQQIVKRSRLTHVCFDPWTPTVVVGDDKGYITSLKISPNLRKNAIPFGNVTAAIATQTAQSALQAATGAAIASNVAGGAAAPAAAATNAPTTATPGAALAITPAAAGNLSAVSTENFNKMQIATMAGEHIQKIIMTAKGISPSEDR